jgi:glycosyltransferase involved in cell wall biosynthesis
VRILLLQESDWVEKGPQQLHHLVERLRDRGHEVRVVDFEIRWRQHPEEGFLAPRRVFSDVHKSMEVKGVTVVRPAFLRLPIADFASAFFTHRLEIRRQIREFQPNVLVGLGILNARNGIRLAHKAGIPFVYYLIDSLYRLVEPPVLRGPAKLVEQANLRRADVVLSINEALRDYTIEMGAPPQRSSVLRAGVDLQRYTGADGSAIRDEYGLAPDDTVLFFMGEFYPFSGLKEVAKDLVSRPEGGRVLKLLAVGRGKLQEELQHLAAQDSASRRIHLVGWQPYSELPRYLAAADICLLPAHQNDIMRDIVPIKVYEYMAAGKPVIATRLPGLVREFGENHGVVYVDDPREVVPKARELVESGTLPSLGEAARSFVSQYDWEKITDEFEATLKRLISASAGSR